MQTVYIIEDDVLLRDLIIDLLRDRPQYKIIGHSGDGIEGLKQCERLTPDIVVLDVRLPSLSGVEVAMRLRNEKPNCKILVFSGAFNLSIIKRVFMAKVAGIIEKSAGLAEMERAFEAVASGQSYYGPEILKRMPKLLSGSGDEESIDSLTNREREVLQLIAEGYTTKEIAAKLGISARTADVHRSHIMQKLNVHNVAGLVRAAISFGLVAEP